jgi:allophanate hydrolase subunit 2
VLELEEEDDLARFIGQARPGKEMRFKKIKRKEGKKGRRERPRVAE